MGHAWKGTSTEHARACSWLVWDPPRTIEEGNPGDSTGGAGQVRARLGRVTSPMRQIWSA